MAFYVLHLDITGNHRDPWSDKSHLPKSPFLVPTVLCCHLHPSSLNLCQLVMEGKKMRKNGKKDELLGGGDQCWSCLPWIPMSIMLIPFSIWGVLYLICSGAPFVGGFGLVWGFFPFILLCFVFMITLTTHGHSEVKYMQKSSFQRGGLYYAHAEHLRCTSNSNLGICYFLSFAFAISIKLCKNGWHRINFCHVLCAFFRCNSWIFLNGQLYISNHR